MSLRHFMPRSSLPLPRSGRRPFGWVRVLHGVRCVCVVWARPCALSPVGGPCAVPCACAVIRGGCAVVVVRAATRVRQGQ